MGYTCIELSRSSKDFLAHAFITKSVFKKWRVLAHHVTLNMGRPRPEHVKFMDKECIIRIDGIGVKPNRVWALRVSRMFVVEGSEELRSTNNTAHITMGVNETCSAKPKESNDILTWESIPSKVLTGTLRYMP